MSNLDDVHEALWRIDDAIAQVSRFENYERKEVPAEDLDRLCVAVNYVLEFDRTAYTEMPGRLGVSASTLQKFLKFKGTVKVRDAKKVADRLKTYVRSLDQAASTQRFSSQIQLESVTAGPTPQFAVQGQTWLAQTEVGETKRKIALVSSLLDSIIVQVRSSNLQPENQLLSDLERHQLIAVLETTLLVLKAPLVEKGLLTRAKDDLQKAAKSATEKQVQQGVGELASHAATLLKELLKSFF